MACFLADKEHDAVTVVAALLHDVVEDTDYTLAQIRQNFGDEVAFIVDGVTKFSCCKTCTIDKIKQATDVDKRVLIVKLADRIHNLQTLSGMKNLSKQRNLRRQERSISLWQGLISWMIWQQLSDS
ncbi:MULTISPECIES: HD domain-containing protein [unclassified Streptococcus]|uniref:HD domain-containing protein n=1 Tax=unclassified Streptococcus TaxID=2608887 RepID=UPI00359CF42E